MHLFNQWRAKRQLRRLFETVPRERIEQALQEAGWLCAERTDRGSVYVKDGARLAFSAHDMKSED